ncbi:Lysine permease LysP [Bienertia sinuspersici]
MSLRGDANREAKATKPYRIRNAKAFPSKVFFCSDFESMGLPLFLILFLGGQIKNETQK